MKNGHLMKYIFIPVIIAVLLASIAVSAVFFLLRLSDREFAVRVEVVEDVASDTAKAVDLTYEYAVDETIICEKAIETSNIDSTASLLDLLQQVNTETEASTYMVAFTEQGRYYYASDTEREFDVLHDDSFLNNMEGTGIQEFIADLTGKECIYAVRALPVAITVEPTVVITHVAAAIDLKALQTAFPDENLYEHSAIYLVSDDGSSIYHDPSSSYQGVEVANVFQALEQRNFVAGGTVDDLKIAVGNSQLTAMQFERDDGLWYVASAPSQETELSVLLFSPEEAIDITDNTAIAELILLFIAFVLCVVVLALVLISIEYKIRVNRQLRSGQNGAIVVEDSRPLSIISPEDNFPSDKDYDSPTYIEAKSNYLSKVTKDIQDPVNGIIGLTNNALQNQNDVSGLEDCLYKISGTSNKLISLVNDVLDMSRLESGAALMEKSKFNLLSLVDNCAAMVGGKLIMRKIPFEADIAHFEHKEVVGDEMRLRRILLNFLNCAEKLCVDGGSMTFRATEVSSDETVARYRFVIDERGGGMSEQCLSHIFEPFTLQEDETGLGLTVAKRFAELMGGSVTVTSELGKGSVFTVELGLSIDNGTEVFPASFEEQPIESDKLS